MILLFMSVLFLFNIDVKAYSDEEDERDKKSEYFYQWSEIQPIVWGKIVSSDKDNLTVTWNDVGCRYYGLEIGGHWYCIEGNTYAFTRNNKETWGKRIDTICPLKQSTEGINIENIYYEIKDNNYVRGCFNEDKLFLVDYNDTDINGNYYIYPNDDDTSDLRVQKNFKYGKNDSSIGLELICNNCISYDTDDEIYYDHNSDVAYSCECEVYEYSSNKLVYQTTSTTDEVRVPIKKKNVIYKVRCRVTTSTFISEWSDWLFYAYVKPTSKITYKRANKYVKNVSKVNTTLRLKGMKKCYWHTPKNLSNHKQKSYKWKVKNNTATYTYKIKLNAYNPNVIAYDIIPYVKYNNKYRKVYTVKNYYEYKFK